MKCEICQSRTAEIHIQQIVGKEKIDLHLCENCAAERGISGGEDKIELSIANLLTGLVDIQRVKDEKRVCPQCGAGWKEISQKKRLGCSECYTAFSREIRSLLKKMVGSSQHKGKFPRRLRPYKTFLVDVVKLKRGLKEALKREDYETAAQLRDRIQALEESEEQK